MSRNLRARIVKLERRTTAGPRRTILDVLLGRASPDELDETARERLLQREADPLKQHPAMIFLREQWARLGIADPGEYHDIDIIKEAIRLAGIPTPSVLPCGLKELPANEPTPP
jgi:hypothetical protein